MTYHGHVEGGVVVLDDAACLPDGAKVTVSLLDFLQEDSTDDTEGPTLYERLLPVIGIAKGLPPDASQNVDHYLYGAPRQ